MLLFNSYIDFVFKKHAMIRQNFKKNRIGIDNK